MAAQSRGYPREVDLDGRGEGPHDPGMEVRISAVERDVTDIKGILLRLEPAIVRVDAGVRKLETDLAELKGKVSQLPGTLTLIGFVIAVLVSGGLMRHFFP